MRAIFYHRDTKLMLFTCSMITDQSIILNVR